MSAPTKVKATTRQTLTERTPVFAVRSIARRTQSRSGEAPTPDEIRQVESAVAVAMAGFCDTEYARTPSRRQRGVRAETRQQAEKFETMVARWVRANQPAIVEDVNNHLSTAASNFEVSRIIKATSKSFDLEIRFRRRGERKVHRLPANVKVNAKQTGLSLVAGESALAGYGCTGASTHAVEGAYRAWRNGARGNGYLVLAYLGSDTARAEQVVFYDPVLTDPDNWEWNLRYPQLQATHIKAAAAYGREKLPATFDAAGARFLAALLTKIRERNLQRLAATDTNWEVAGLGPRPWDTPAAKQPTRTTATRRKR